MENLNNNLETEGLDENTETKTYTKEEVDALLQAESDRRVSDALKKADRKKELAVKEAEKLAQMGADEKFKYELEQREKALLEKEAKLALMENKNEASKLLSEKGISLVLVDFVVAEDAETMMTNINLLENEFKKSVKAEVEKRLAGNTPKQNLNNGEFTKESFSKLGISEQSRLIAENPQLEKFL